jgi:hypothetical protein
MPTKSLGSIDIAKLLERPDGKLQFDLIDAGMIRHREASFTFDLVGGSLAVTRIKSRGTAKTIRLPLRIGLTPQFLILVGLYDGDGNKTGEIGFAQNESHLQKFVGDRVGDIFGSQFEEAVTILEDTLYFEGAVAKQWMKELRAEVVKRCLPESETVERRLMERILLERYSGDPFSDESNVGYVLSPKKGARMAGQSSYEIIINQRGSRDYLDLFLCTLKETIRSVLSNQKSTTTGIEWDVAPADGSLQVIDIELYISEGPACWIDGRGRTCRYEITGKTSSTLTLRKTTKSAAFSVNRFMPITPAFLLFTGLYLAEGTTAKSRLFTFREGKEELALGFNSSEDESLGILMRGLGALFPDVTDVIDQWIVKIGTKYFPETNILADKLDTSVLRGGPKGQGYSRSIEIAEAYRLWATKQFPSIAPHDNLFTHIEFTGSGIPRVDVRLRPAPAALLFSLFVDLGFNPANIEPYLCDLVDL